MGQDVSRYFSKEDVQRAGRVLIVVITGALETKIQ